MNRAAKELGRFFQSQTEAAARLGIGPSMLSLLLAGERKPSIETAVAIQREYGVSCEGWVEEEPQPYEDYPVLSMTDRLRINDALEEPASTNAVDPSAASTGTPTPRDKESSS